MLDNARLLNRIGVSAVDLTDGSTVWTHTALTGPYPILPDVTSSEDGTRTLLGRLDSDGRSLDEYTVLDTETGEETASERPDGFEVRWPNPGDQSPGLMVRDGDARIVPTPQGLLVLDHNRDGFTIAALR